MQLDYSWEYTPIWYHLSSPIMYTGMEISLLMNPKNAPIYKKDDQRAAEFRINGEDCLVNDLQNEKWVLGGPDKLNQVRGVVRATGRTNDATVEAWLPGVGYAAMNENMAKNCNWDGTDCYISRIYPHIESISDKKGPAIGGQELMIEGGGFEDASNVQVTVDDTPCEVKETTASSIKCITEPKTSPLEQ